MEETPTKTGKYAMPSKVYDILVYVTMIVLPAFATFYFTVGSLWGWPNPEQVIGTIVASQLFIGACLKISKTSYDNSELRFDGKFNVSTDSDGDKAISMKADLTPEEFAGKSEIVFKVNHEPR